MTTEDKKNVLIDSFDTLRLGIDEHAKIANAFLHVPDSLLLAKGWIGKMKGCLGVGSPYKNDGKRKTVSDIEPTDAHEKESKFTGYMPEDDDEAVRAIEHLRAVIKTSLELLESIEKQTKELYPEAITLDFAVFRTNAFTCLHQASMQCGFALQRIRERYE